MKKKKAKKLIILRNQTDTEMQILSDSKKKLLKKHQRQSNLDADDQKLRFGESSSILGNALTPGKTQIFPNNVNSNIIEGPKEGVIAHKMRLNS